MIQKSIHPEQRESAHPLGGTAVLQNPPVLLWPRTEGKTIRYSVRVGRSVRFADRSTLRSDGLRWAMFNPHRKLDPGKWFWQYGVRKGKAETWSDVFEFLVDRSARQSETPHAESLVAACPDSHPRLWVDAEGLSALRRRFRRSGTAERFQRQAKAYMGRSLPNDGAPPDRGQTEFEIKAHRRWASKALAGSMKSGIQVLAPLYLMTGDVRYGREAIRWGLAIAEWDPHGFTAPEVSDFADGSCMRAMAHVYDSCFDLLSEEERVVFREAMTVRANRFFLKVTNDLETRLFAAHIWQHILLEFLELALVTLHEIPDATTWLSYVYELWLARFPLMGGADGGWANGNSYFGTNVETLLTVPDLFQRLLGLDLYRNPWYRHAAEFAIYTWPPGSASDGFGDGGEREGPPPVSRLLLVEALARRLKDPYALWYVRTSATRTGEGRSLSIDGEQFTRRNGHPQTALEWHRIRSTAGRTGVRARSPGNLPQARAFRDVGIVAMHTDLAHTEKNLMVGFRSSPYAVFGHAHADQNSFNVLFGGQRIFQNSGYYIAYGDAHFNGWYKHTRGHNSLLIDGQGQMFGADRSSALVRHNTDGYGRVSRFLNGKRISYCAGDASQAYGDTGLTRFVRHVALLRPNLIVIYDDLEADHPAEWSWLLHSARKMTSAPSKLRFRGRSKTAEAQVNLWGSGPLQMQVNDRFDPPALNWRRHEIGGGIPKEYPNQWHATVQPAVPLLKSRFLAVIQVLPRKAVGPFAEPDTRADGEIRVGDWRIRAQMEGSAPAYLEVRHRDGKSVLVSDLPGARVGGRRFRTGGKAGSLLVEVLGRRTHVARCGDEWPDSVK